MYKTHCADDILVKDVVGDDDDTFEDHLVAEQLFNPGGVPADGRVVGQEELQIVELLTPIHQSDARQPAQGHRQGEHDHRVRSNHTPQPEKKHGNRSNNIKNN